MNFSTIKNRIAVRVSSIRLPKFETKATKIRNMETENVKLWKTVLDLRANLEAFCESSEYDNENIFADIKRLDNVAKRHDERINDTNSVFEGFEQGLVEHSEKIDSEFLSIDERLNIVEASVCDLGMEQENNVTEDSLTEALEEMDLICRDDLAAELNGVVESILEDATFTVSVSC